MRFTRISLIFTLLVLPAFLVSGEPEILTKTDSDFVKREQMIVMSRQLGVTCVYCHNLKNLKSSEKKTFKIAKNHMDVVTWINTKGFQPPSVGKVDCYACHRGKAVPDYKEHK